MEEGEPGDDPFKFIMEIDRLAAETCTDFGDESVRPNFQNA